MKVFPVAWHYLSAQAAVVAPLSIHFSTSVIACMALHGAVTEQLSQEIYALFLTLKTKENPIYLV